MIDQSQNEASYNRCVRIYNVSHVLLHISIGMLQVWNICFIDVLIAGAGIMILKSTPNSGFHCRELI